MAFVIRPSDDMLKHIESIMENTGNKTKSKVIEYVLSQHEYLERKVESQEGEINKLNNELSDIKNILRRKAVADQAYQRLIESISPNDTI